VPEKRRCVPFETVREAPCATSSTSLQLRSVYADGQSFAYPLGRTATALGRNSRGRLRSVKLLAMSRYVTSRHRIFLHEYRGDSALKFVDVKTIKSVIAMIPHLPVIRGQEVHNRFFLVEKLGFDIALIAGTEEVLLRNGDTALDGED
jgi:hypothetical protein